MLGYIGWVKTKGDLLSLERNVPAIPRNPARSHPTCPGQLPLSSACLLACLPVCLLALRAAVLETDGAGCSMLTSHYGIHLTKRTCPAPTQTARRRPGP